MENQTVLGHKLLFTKTLRLKTPLTVSLSANVRTVVRSCDSIRMPSSSLQRTPSQSLTVRHEGSARLDVSLRNSVDRHVVA